jgi:hypothetical protein
VLATVQRYAVSRGISGRYSRKGPRVQTPDSATAAVVQAEVAPV